MEHSTHSIIPQLFINHVKTNQGAEWKTQTRSQVSVYKRETNKNTGAFQVTESAMNAPTHGTVTESRWNWSRDSVGVLRKDLSGVLRRQLRQDQEEGPIMQQLMKTVQVGEEQVIP